MRIKAILLVLSLSFLASCALANSLGYALSGGGARGLAHIGILKVLEEYGLKPDYIAGTSIGAFIGALYSMGYSSEQIEELVLSWDWNDLLRDDESRDDLNIALKRWPPYGNLELELDDSWSPRLGSGIFSANNLNLYLAEIFAPASEYNDFSQLPIPFCAVSTNLVTGEERVFNEGSLMQAVRASLSVPSIIKPIELEGSLYIDGGISSNYPVRQARELGADLVLGFKANSELRTIDQLSDPIRVIDQTINIGMTNTISSIQDSLLITLEPDLSQYSARSFESARLIIEAGEQYARNNIDRLISRLQDLGYRQNSQARASIPPIQKFRLGRIRVIGNRYISCSKILEYLDLQPGNEYTAAHIVRRCRFAWNSRLFVTIYPVIYAENGFFNLHIIVEERNRKGIVLNLCYQSEDLLHASAVLHLNNYLLRNSKLLAELRIGNNNEFNLDYVKNFGDFSGIYYRLYNYITERTSYIYDDNHQKTDSVRRLEYGSNLSLGLFANDFINLEAFLYGYNANLYRDISNNTEIRRHFNIGGYGIKLYHESLNDFIIPSSGLLLMAKYNAARTGMLSDYVYNKFWAQLHFYRPLSEVWNIHFGMDYGSYFEAGVQSQLDPFYLGGESGFMAYDKYELSAPFYKVFSIALSYNKLKNTQISFGIQSLNHSDQDDWSLNQDLDHSLFTSMTYETIMGPIKATIAFPLSSKPKFYLNIGYSYDLFKFSRR